ncbi:phosphotransferase family enzyme [Rhodovulum imhoffii]|uniref:Phosphotransferase family enzyme n=1 Tax=Rhodovulum imhoffii TaxID=365340 RepID=A0A2T5BW74_9RHOB|nr:phosphotransferase [Rhodovulum imhoffii]MBK5935144.1 hypothetical protein [Rhodovulum imhoffii]PTN03889.1 phosphotransferase family enzyme [Rhodovulum imhoffii]
MSAENIPLPLVLEASEELTDLQNRRKAVAAFTAESVLAAHERSAVYAGLYDGQPAILKLFRGPNFKKKARRQKQEMERLATFMSTGRYRTPELLDAWVNLGITVTTRIEGKTLAQALIRASLGERDHLIAEAGHWLSRLAGPTLFRDTFAGKFWLSRKRNDLPRIQYPPDMVLARALLARLEALIPDVRGHSVTKAEIHGDFSPPNLILTETALYGVDIQSVAPQPLVRDIARFLLYLHIVIPQRDSGLKFGVSERDIDVMLGTVALPENERQTLLPFFIGLEMVDKLARLRPDHVRAAALRGAINRYLETV